MDVFDKKTLKTSRGYTYTYYTSSGDKTLPALIFQHGWPDHAAMWADIAGPLRSLNHPIVIPDMLGYDGTDKPTDPAAYRWDGMTRDIIEIIDAEQHEKVISIGHDWGSTAASRLTQYYPDRVVGLANLNVPYTPPGRQPFSLEKVNQMTQQIFGYQFFAYWQLFTADDGAEILDKNLERLYHAMHSQGDVLKTMFCTPGALREYLLTGNQEITLRPYALSPTLRSTFLNQFTTAGMTAPMNWYKATVLNHQHASDSALPETADKINVPVLYIGTKEDPMCKPETMIPSIRAGLLPKLEQAEMVDAGHWVTYEKPEEIVGRIRGWVGKHFHAEN
ncbi:epoxide hydrolase-like protein [Plenodomus tracheiphilus IPT5]|uniref:Epoxide hydrolase-like protein n=1 Tax=Plenodomus tracheiphilus IPT5 TaxID=1408161 RepID=A0A6A7AVQ3_9PLEO|nr:epoxide hydrolase-like protein [Plenodomus tracheiphilus IPT5]